MTHTPTRPPDKPTHGRRPPRGPRVPRQRPFRERLQIASDRLMAAGHEDSAADVAAVLAPGGWQRLKPTAGEEAGTATTLSVLLPEEIRDALKDAGAALSVSLSAEASDGFRAVLRGDWTPPMPVRAVRSTKPKARKNLNLTIDDGLRRELREALPALTQELGYRRSLTEASVAAAWLCEQLGVDREPSTTLKLVVPGSLRSHWEKAATKQKTTLQQVLDHGLRALFAGTWQMPVPHRAPSGRAVPDPQPQAVVKVTIPIDIALHEQLLEAAPEFAARFDRRVFPATIAIAVLKDKLGEPS